MTATYLAADGTAMLLVKCDEPPTDDFIDPGWFWATGWDDKQTYGIWAGGWETPAPHAPGDVIQIGDQQATVTEILPPVRVEDLTAEEIEASGIDVARLLPRVLSATGSGSVEDFLDYMARIALREDRPELTATTWVWREKVNAATAAEEEK